jgi:hypothetical protein
MNRLLIILTCVYFIACTNDKQTIDIKGSWYFDTGEDGEIEPSINYSEIYITDSLYYIQDETFGQNPPNKYYLTNDTMMISALSNNLQRTFIYAHKIIGLIGDTLVLKGIARDGSITDYKIIKLPKGELGHYDYNWTEENKDSLNFKIVNDYHRRMWKYHYQKANDLRTYDSLLNAGRWDWTMKDILEAEKREKELERRN